MKKQKGNPFGFIKVEEPKFAKKKTDCINVEEQKLDKENSFDFIKVQEQKLGKENSFGFIEVEEQA